MKEKSLGSLRAAQLLIETHETYGYDASIHCSYYSVLQYMKFVLSSTERSPIEYGKQNSHGESSHEYIIKAIRDRIENRYQARLLVDDIYDLKNQRRVADYTIMSFTEENAAECKAKAENIIIKLKQQFGNL